MNNFYPPSLLGYRLILTRLLLIQTCLLILVLPVSANDSNVASMNKNELSKQLDALLQAGLKQKIPGIILLVETPKSKYLNAAGVANRKTKQAMQTDSYLRIASISKTYTAALAVKLLKQKQISLDTPVIPYIDEAVLKQLPTGIEPTYTHLLNHTSGIPDYYTPRFYLNFDFDAPLTLPLALKYIAGKSATNTPGGEYHYSNTNFHILAHTLEKLYQRPLAELLNEYLLQPLSLQETKYNLHHHEKDNIHGYGTAMSTWKDTYEWLENSGPDGGIKATAEDINQWLRILLAKDGDWQKIGNVMIATTIPTKTRQFQGLGIEVLQSKSGVKFYGHTGNNFGYLSAAFYSPQLDTSVVLHINKGDDDEFSRLLGGVLRTILSNTHHE